MEWVLKLEIRNDFGEMEMIEVGRLERRVVGLSAEQLGLTLAEAKNLLGELGRLVLQTQMEEFITCARVLRRLSKTPASPRSADPQSPDAFWSASTRLVSAPAGTKAGCSAPQPPYRSKNERGTHRSLWRSRPRAKGTSIY